MGGRMSRLGTGRVWSEMMMVQRFFPAARAARVGVPMGDDVMLAYQDVSFHDDNTMRELSHRLPAPEFHEWAMKMGILDKDGRLGERAGDASMFFAK